MWERLPSMWASPINGFYFFPISIFDVHVSSVTWCFIRGHIHRMAARGWVSIPGGDRRMLRSKEFERLERATERVASISEG